MVNTAAFAIHSQVHAARPDVVAAAHSHSLHGKAWSSLGRLLDPITQDACAFFEDHALFDDFTGVVLDVEEGKRIGAALGENKAVILRNHGAVTYGRDLAQAYDRALLLEWLARTYRMALSYGEPATLSAAELDEVTAETRRRRYGERRSGGGPP